MTIIAGNKGVALKGLLMTNGKGRGGENTGLNHLSVDEKPNK